MAVPLVLIPVLDRRPLAVITYLLGVGATTGAGVLLLYAQSGSWVEYFLVRLPRQHQLELDQFGVFWTRKLLPGASILLLFAPVFFIGRGLRREYQVIRFWLLVSLGMLGIAWGATLNRWSDDNVLLPAFAVLVVLGMCGFDEALRQLGTASPHARAFRNYAFALVAIEFLIVAYNPRQTAPLRSDVWGLDRFVQTVAAIPGTVFAPDSRSSPTRLAKASQLLASVRWSSSGVSAVGLAGEQRLDRCVSSRTGSTAVRPTAARSRRSGAVSD